MTSYQNKNKLTSETKISRKNEPHFRGNTPKRKISKNEEFPPQILGKPGAILKTKPKSHSRQTSISLSGSKLSTQGRSSPEIVGGSELKISGTIDATSVPSSVFESESNQGHKPPPVESSSNEKEVQKSFKISNSSILSHKPRPKSRAQLQKEDALSERSYVKTTQVQKLPRTKTNAGYAKFEHVKVSRKTKHVTKPRKVEVKSEKLRPTIKINGVAAEETGGVDGLSDAGTKGSLNSLNLGSESEEDPHERVERWILESLEAENKPPPYSEDTETLPKENVIHIVYSGD